MLVMQGGKLEVEATYSLPNVTTTELCDSDIWTSLKLF